MTAVHTHEHKHSISPACLLNCQVAQICTFLTSQTQCPWCCQHKPKGTWHLRSSVSQVNSCSAPGFTPPGPPTFESEVLFPGLLEVLTAVGSWDSPLPGECPRLKATSLPKVTPLSGGRPQIGSRAQEGYKGTALLPTFRIQLPVGLPSVSMVIPVAGSGVIFSPSLLTLRTFPDCAASQSLAHSWLAGEPHL